MLKKIQDDLYMYRAGSRLYTLQKGEIGILGSGECYRLRMSFANVDSKVLLGVYVTIDDGYKCYTRPNCIEHKIWNSIDSIIKNAESIIEEVEKDEN